MTLKLKSPRSPKRVWTHAALFSAPTTVTLETLVNDGHMNRVVRHAIACGCDPIVALQMATINTATHFGMEREIGSITPGRRADIILTSDLATLPIEHVIARGVTIAKDGECLVECPHYNWPDHARQTVHLGQNRVAQDFEVAAPSGANSVTANVIGVVENQAPTKALKAELSVSDGRIQMDPVNDVCQIALVEKASCSGYDDKPASSAVLAIKAIWPWHQPLHMTATT